MTGERAARSNSSDTKQILWTPEEVGFFWDWMSANAPDYFTETAGPGILSKARQLLPKTAKRVLDFGSGPGFLTRLLVQSFPDVYALDFSEESIANLRARVPGVVDTFLYSSSPQYESIKVDVVFLIETIEHLDDKTKKDVFEKIRSLLNVGGKLFVSCPNEENLQTNKICCPSCRTEFHRMQHVSSYSPEKLSRELQKFGFKVDHVGVTNFKYGKFGQKVRELSSSVTGRKLPHLYACASL